MNLDVKLAIEDGGENRYVDGLHEDLAARIICALRERNVWAIANDATIIEAVTINGEETKL